MDEVIQDISNHIDNIQDWNLEDFNFDFPTSQYESDCLYIINFLQTPNFNECEELAQGNIKLNNEQLEQLRQTATFQVPSKNFEGQVHVWKVSKWLQTGVKNIKKSVRKTFESFYKFNYFHVLNRKYITISNSIKNIFSIINLPTLLFGKKKLYKKNSDYEIQTELSYYINNKIIESSKLPLYSQNYCEMIKILQSKYSEFIKQWDIEKVSRRKELYNIFSKNNSSSNKILQLIIDYENEQLQEKVFDLINNNFEQPEAEMLMNLVKSNYIIKNCTQQFNKLINDKVEEYNEKLKNDHPYKSKIPQFLHEKKHIFKKQLIDDNYQSLIDEISNKLQGEAKYIFDLKQQILQSDEYNNYKKQLNDEVYPKKFNFWFRKWKKSTDFFEGKKNKYNLLQSNTSYIGWRIVNLILHSGKLLNNGLYILLNNLIYGRFGLRSLYGIQDFTLDKYKTDANLDMFLYAFVCSHK